MGLKLAESIHNFVYNRGVSAYIYWLGVVKSSNESLINSDGNTYTFNKNNAEKVVYIKIDHDIDALTPYVTTSEEGFEPSLFRKHFWLKHSLFYLISRLHKRRKRELFRPERII